MAGPVVFVKIEGLDELATKLRHLSALGERALRPLVAKYALKIQGDARRKAPVDTGALRASVLTAYIGDRGLTAEIGTVKGYAPFVELGRRAGARMPPPDALKGWVARHGMKPGAEYAVARAIKKRGIQPRPFMGPAWELHAPEFVKEAAAVLRDNFKSFLK